MVAAGTWLAPYFLQAQGAGKNGFSGKRLIVIQLSGGNDGLNTIVPFENDLYYKARPQIGVKKSEVLMVNDQLGFNPALEALRPLLMKAWEYSQRSCIRTLIDLFQIHEYLAYSQ